MARSESEQELRRELSEVRARLDQLTANAAAAERDATRYRLLLEHLNVGVFVSSLDGRMLECNDRTVQMSGETRESLLSNDLVTHYEDPNDRARLVAELRANGSVRNFETWTRQRGGKRVASSMNAVLAPIGPGGTRLILGMLEDITDRKLAEARAREGEERLRAMSLSMERTAKLESLGVLAAGIAHDFNNLLGGLFGHLDLAREQLDSGSPARANLDLAHGAFERAEALTGQLLAFAKGGAPVRKVSSLANRVRRCAEFALSGSSVNVELDLQLGLWHAELDENQVAQAFHNILINAKQAMPQGGILRIRGRNVDAEQGPAVELPPGRYVKLSFADRGHGISPAILERIFEPFFSTKAEGSGIGLTAAYAILKKHDGHIEVESEPGAGATFHVWLPAVAKNVGGSVPVEREPKAGRGLVLVMDDDDMVRRMVGSMLTHLGYEPIATRDGAEALERARSLLAEGKHLSVAMLDLTVRSGEGGRETVRPLRQLLPDLPVIAWSGYSDDPVMAAPSQFGFSASLRKPFRLSELTELLDQLRVR